jgi:hypothetical protein
MKKIRSYKKLVNEIINLQIPFRTEIAGYAKYGKDTYPIFLFKHTSKTATKTIVITSGHHGDEPFAINILLKWLLKFIPSENQEFNLYIYPVCNPYGYETGSRDNGARQDTNNDKKFIKNSKVQELAILFEVYPVNVDMIIDIHGDTRKENVFIYEHKSENLPSIAEYSLIENDNLIPFLKQKTLDTDKVINGVIIPTPNIVGLEGYMEKLGIDYTMTLELPGKFDGQKRMLGGIAIINSIINKFKELK